VFGPSSLPLLRGFRLWFQSRVLFCILFGLCVPFACVISFVGRGPVLLMFSLSAFQTLSSASVQRPLYLIAVCLLWVFNWLHHTPCLSDRWLIVRRLFCFPLWARCVSYIPPSLTHHGSQASLPCPCFSSSASVWFAPHTRGLRRPGPRSRIHIRYERQNESSWRGIGSQLLKKRFVAST
jgi:hypothetical protein